MIVTMRPLESRDLEPLTIWRSRVRPYLRTARMLSVDDQREWFRSLPMSQHRYYAFDVETQAGKVVAGVGGLTYIQWENGTTELSLVTDPVSARRGIGRSMFCGLMMCAFEELRLVTVTAECYHNNPALGFWKKMEAEFGGSSVVLPRRKFYGGNLYDATYFSWAAPR